MKKNKMKSAFSAVAACSLSGIVAIATLAPMAQIANAEVTSPVGFVKLTFNAESDTPFSLPMNRPKVYIGQVNSISGNTINIANADFTASELVYADGSQNEKYYLLFTTGTLEGRTFDVTANDTNSITVDQGGDTDVQTLNGATTDSFEIRPHWTLNILFPDGAGIDVSTDFSLPDQVILAKNTTDIGTRLQPTSSYFYYDSNDEYEGWYDNNDLSATNVGSTVLRNTLHYTFRNKKTEDLIKNIVGDVPLTDGRVQVATLSDEIQQDNHIAIPFPVEMTLDQAGFRQIADFKTVTDFNVIDGDLILEYPDNAGVLRPSPTASYFYYESGDSFEGWYDNNDLSRQNLGVAKLIKPGRAYIFRRSADKFEGNTFIKPIIPYSPLAE
jgi:uncharacterized protein (TIGR02597 family)